MGLMRTNKLGSLQFTSVDDFMLRMHSAELTYALDALFAFANRVGQRSARKPTAPFWRVAGPIVITRDYWIAFCSAALHLIGALGHAGCRHDSELPALRASAQRLAELVGDSLATLR